MLSLKRSPLRGMISAEKEGVMPQTLKEIRAAYPREWVLIVECEFDEAERLVGGRVLVHSPHRRDVYARLAELRDERHCAVEYTGPVPEDLKVMF